MADVDIERARAIFTKARELALAERNAYLQQACAGDSDLFAEVRQLLAFADHESLALDSASSSSKIDEAIAAKKNGDSAPCSSAIALDRFTLIRQIGEGGMGDVFLATHPITGLEIAVKRLKPGLVNDPQHVQRFLTEARHMYHLNHPHILRIMEVWDPPAGPYYVMPYMEKGSLANQIQRGQPSDYVFTLRLSRQIADALAYAHSKGIIHRDLKPLNVLMDNEGRAFLSDFGLVRPFNTHDPDLDVRAKESAGTAGYMSPAVSKGEAEDTRCDIYSFGAMLYELLTGHVPYEGKSIYEVRHKVLAGPPKPILKRNPHASPGLVKIAEGAMGRELRDRYSSMADVLADLARLEHDKPPVGPHGRELKKSPIQWIVAAAALAAVVITAFVVVRRWPQIFPHAPLTAKEIIAHLPGTTSSKLLVEVKAIDPTLPFLPPPPTLVTHTDSAGHRVVDLMPLIDPARDGGGGVWRKNANGISSDADENCMLRIPYEPPAEYDFKVEFTRVEGNAEVFQCLSANTTQVWWVMGREWGQNHNVFCGFWRYWGDYSKEAQGDHPCHTGGLTTGRKYTSVIQVRHDSIAVLLDGDEIVRFKTDYHDMWVPGFRKWLGLDLGVGSKNSPTLFHSIEVVERSAKGTAWPHAIDGPELRRVMRAYPGSGHVFFSPDGRFVASLGFNDEGFFLWGIGDTRPLVKFPGGGHTRAFLPGGRGVITCGGPQYGWYDFAGNWTSLDDVEENFNWLDYSTKASLLATGAFGHPSIHIYDTSDFPTLKEVRNIQWEKWVPSDSQANWFIFSPDGSQIATYIDGQGLSTIVLIGTATGTELWHSQSEGPHLPRSLAFDNRGKRILGFTQKLACVRDAKTGEIIARCEHRTNVRAAFFSADDKFFFTADHDPAGGLHCWNLSTGKEIERFTTPVAVNGLALSKDGHRLLAACDDWTVRLFDADTGRQLHRYIGHDKAVNCVAFSPDEMTFASGSDDRTVRIWNVLTGPAALTHPATAPTTRPAGAK
ncbi:MAG TPA: serine/threonine-protein kinase [Tepidisphaeraceae bacterium]|nr:serine/threonine-protein kinase [Tepidisphaeraceae bacterium]